MELTFIGVAQLLIGGAIVVAGGLRSALAFLIVSGLFGGSAAISLPALGGATIVPEQFALLFVFLRILAPRGGFAGLLPEAVRANIWLCLFTFYGMAAAIIMPRIFEGAIDVYPMRMLWVHPIFYTTPLVPTPQNITALIYLLGSLLVALSAWITCRVQGGAGTIVSATLWTAWVLIALGLLVAVSGGTPLEAFFDLFRNSTYAQLDSDAGGFVRIRGLFPESSTYASFGFGLFAILAELWYRSIRTRATGAAALALAAVLFFSTSSTAYVGLFAYLVFFVLRVLALPEYVDWAKVRTAAACFAGAVFVSAVLMAVVPDLPQAIFKMLMEMTLDKASSESGEQRLFWTMQGIDAFVASYGLGMGPGSFRSSSMLFAIVGTMGVFGVACFLMYLIRVVQPGKLSTWVANPLAAQSVGGAFSSAALLALVPAAVNSANAHPSTTFAVLAGAALALRPREAAAAPKGRRAGTALPA